LTSPKDESVFFVLGALDEYLGRTIIDGDELNSCYRVDASDRDAVRTDADGQVRRTARTLETRLFMRAAVVAVDEHGLPESIFFRRRALAYLAGAWLRYGHDPDFVFVNAREKVQLVASLLSSLGCHEIRIESTVGLVPQGNAVHFTPTDEVKWWLRRNW